MIRTRVPIAVSTAALRPALIAATMLFCVIAPFAGNNQVAAANFVEAEQMFRSGKIDAAEAIASAEVERGIWNRRWSELLIQCQLATGQYESALETYDAALKRYPTSLPLRVLGVEVTQYNGLPDRTASEKAMIDRYLQTGQLRFATVDTLIAAGRFFSQHGIDARVILKSFYDRVLESDPRNLEAMIATAELAVSKGDFKVAAETVRTAKQRELEDARLDYLLALSLQGTNPPAANESLNRALTLNPTYTPALILKAEKRIDREDYAGAEQTIQVILKTNPQHPLAFALQAVMAHLAGDFEREKELRAKALQHWSTNPEVDHLIGRKLSDKYRFAEGAQYQRLALTFDPSNIPATFQLAQDLLRLGDDDVGWKLAEQVNAEDPYNVVAYNLMTLKDRVDGFETIRTGDPDQPLAGEILIRMDPRERQVYGNAVVDLLSEAKRLMCEKYDLVLDRPVIVEIFPKQSDFAIRTFGLPGGEGFLGVCFGRVITANSPASQGARPSNWESVLWHEFCHVITLTKSGNRMPRWLSEGISVYEERLRDPRWGQSMTAQYREMILGDDYTPVSQLSGAFLNPPSPAHLQFAYYESSLVVQFLVEQHGIEKLNGILMSLADGIPMADALATHVGSIDRLEVEFAEYAQQLANEFGEGLDFQRHELPEDAPHKEILEWAADHPNNYWARMTLGRNQLQNNEFQAAAEHFEFLRGKGVATGGRDGVLESLAHCYRELDDEPQERQTLTELFSLSADALPSLERFIQMETQQQHWESVLQSAKQAIEIQPFAVGMHQAIVTACDRLDQREMAIDSLRSLAAMDPVDVAGLNYQTAQSLAAAEQVEQAKEHLIDALLLAPRYRDAHHLLLELESAESVEETATETDPAGDAVEAEAVENEADQANAEVEDQPEETAQ
ncbi:tetratricopeptide repeat protein [Stieleria sp. TO1_6]|uniref:tetratricopeptide repeat protein n=1 Tax=Stieleria tagensis TaxID=2956795 RepID=UPI00209B161D|nr:tetratricopeptide repeat protein [Stieleria tagensis]MCO8125355.1 tetratricopeptide repeat protein [Stieleria tagensis]